MSAVTGCPAWCVDQHNPGDDDEFVWHHGQEHWLANSRGVLTLGLVSTSAFDGAQSETDIGPCIEIGGVDGSTYTPSLEIELDDVQQLIDALRDLVGRAMRVSS